MLSAINGKGKTTVLSHIADAFYEMARTCYSQSFEGKEYKFYRLSSELFSLEMSKYSIVYLRFRHDDETIDYVDFCGDITEEQYTNEIKLRDVIPFRIISSHFKGSKCAKFFTRNFNNADYDKVEKIFGGNILTFFPAYRYENPSYLSDPYRISTTFKSDIELSGSLKNPIEVVTEAQMLVNWVMDVVLDMHLDEGETVDGGQRDQNKEQVIFANLCNILSAVLSSKHKEGCLEFCIGKRDASGQRVSIVQKLQDGTRRMVTPSIFSLSTGELSLLCLFGEIMRQADNLHANINLDNVEGVVLIDEVDLHLHIKLQKEVLPQLFNLYPNIQFIVSTHSPFPNMGLADYAMDRTQVIDLDNNGITCPPTNSESYKEVYGMMIGENDRFAAKYKELLGEIEKNNKPLIITEGKTDCKHIGNAIKVLGRTDVDIEFYECGDVFGSRELEKMLEILSRVKRTRLVIGIFDRDEEKVLKDLGAEHSKYKSYGNNVYAFAIPLVNEDIYGVKTISIEHYYTKKDLLKEDKEHRRLFLGEEFHSSGNSKDGRYQTRIGGIGNKVGVNGIIDEKVYDAKKDLEQKYSIALSKSGFAELIGDDDYARGFDFSNFNKILDVIREITEMRPF